MELISSKLAPVAIGPYSHAIKSGNLLFCSGQLGIDPSTAKLCSEDTLAQTKQIFVNIREILATAGLSLTDIVKTTIFLRSMDDFKSVNDMYGKEFKGHKPARTTVEISKLPLDAKIEIECVAEF